MSVCTHSPRTPVAEHTLYMRPLPAALAALTPRRGAPCSGGRFSKERSRLLQARAAVPHASGSYLLRPRVSRLCAQRARRRPTPPLERLLALVQRGTARLLQIAREVRRSGITLDEAACLARCNGAAATVNRAGQTEAGAFRKDLLAATTASDGPVLIVNYSRSAVGQTGSGHFSPIGGFDAATDQALVLDTARFKYPPHWLPVELLFAAMQERDADTGDARGWMLLEELGRT